MIVNSSEVEILQRQIDSEIYKQISPSLHPIIRKIYASRGLKESNHSLQYLKKPDLIKGIDKASSVVKEAIINNQTICIIGDYDVDGATSTALLLDGLKKLGAKNLHYLVPNRMIDGYGLTEKIVKKLLKKLPDTKLIITVDNGTSSFDGVEFAKKSGVKVVITDHHLPSEKLPNANGIVNPNLENNHPLKYLSGVGVSFYFLCSLIELFKNENLLKNEINLKNYLDLVALGTVADCVQLDFNNRILVLNGIEVIKKRNRAGINALIDLTNQIHINQLSSTDIAFYLAPIINAAGRLKDMSLGIECLISNNEEIAIQMAKNLKSINTQRKEIQGSMQQSANNQLSKIDLKNNCSGYCFFNKNWHEGICGILASKLKEELLKPIIVFAKSEDEKILKGSARSIDSINIKDILESINQKNPKLIKSFGGHAMAAGIQIKAKNLEKFDMAFQQELFNVSKNISDKKPIIYTDGEIEFNEINADLAIEINNSGCWGVGFESPLFQGNFLIHHKSIFAKNHVKLKISTIENSKILFSAVCFNQADKIKQMGELNEKINLCYQLDVSRYNNALQLIVRYLIKND